MRYLCLSLVLVALTACGGGGGDSSSNDGLRTPIEDLRNNATRLGAEFDRATITPTANIPMTGTVQYTGIATFGFLAESSLGEGIGGDMTVDVAFADNAVTGRIDNFYSRDGEARTGLLTFENGRLTRSPGFTIFNADIAGNLDIIGGEKDWTGDMVGTFKGDAADYIGGQVAIESELLLPNGTDTAPLTVDGVYIVERE